MLFTVHDFGKSQVVSYSGGTALGFQNDKPNPGLRTYDTYINSARKMRAESANAGATVLLSNHSEFDNAVTKARELASRGFARGADRLREVRGRSVTTHG